MPVSAVTGRQTLAVSIPWQHAYRMALMLLFEIWDLTENQIVQIYHALFPITHEYFYAKLRDQYHQRWSFGRRERHWRTLDRPNMFDGTPYTNQELLDFAIRVAEIVREANNLNIQLRLKVPATHQLLTYVPSGTAGLPPIQETAPLVTLPPAQTLPAPAPVPTQAMSQDSTQTAAATNSNSPSAAASTEPATSQSGGSESPPEEEPLWMLHSRDVTFEESGAYYFPSPDAIFGDLRQVVDPTSALYALGGRSAVVEDAPGYIPWVADRKALVMICNGTRCGICNEDAPSVEKPVTNAPEDRLIAAEEN